MTRTDYRLVGHLPQLQANRPQPHPWAPQVSARVRSSLPHLWGIEPTFAGVFPTQGQISYVLLSSTPRSCTSRLAWLNRTLIAVLSGGINQNSGFALSNLIANEFCDYLFVNPCIFSYSLEYEIFAVRAFIPHKRSSRDHIWMYYNEQR